jgi:hypothetical protein
MHAWLTVQDLSGNSACCQQLWLWLHSGSLGLLCRRLLLPLL